MKLCRDLDHKEKTFTKIVPLFYLNAIQKFSAVQEHSCKWHKSVLLLGSHLHLLWDKNKQMATFH